MKKINSTSKTTSTRPPETAMHHTIHKENQDVRLMEEEHWKDESMAEIK